MTRTTRLFWSAGVLLVASLMLPGCGGTENAKNDEKPAQPTQKGGEGGAAGANPDVPPKSLVAVKPDVVLTAEELRTHQKKDHDYLYPKHANKVIEVTGVVESAKVGFHSPGVVILKAGPNITDSLICETSDPAPWKKAFPGQQATLRGRSTTDGLRWEIIDAKGPTPVELTADQFATERDRDLTAFNKRYHKQHIILTGVIDKVDLDKFGHARVKLKTEKGTPVLCAFPGASDGAESRNKTFKPSQKLKAIGQYSENNGPDRSLDSCEVLELTP